MRSHLATKRLSAYLDEELPDRELRQVEAHVSECPACQTRLHGLRLVVSELQRVPAVEAPPSLARSIETEAAMRWGPPAWRERRQLGRRGIDLLRDMIQLSVVTAGALAIIATLMAWSIVARPRRDCGRDRASDAPPAPVAESGGQPARARVARSRRGERKELRLPRRNVVAGRPAAGGSDRSAAADARRAPRRWRARRGSPAWFDSARSSSSSTARCTSPIWCRRRCRACVLRRPARRPTASDRGALRCAPARSRPRGSSCRRTRARRRRAGPSARGRPRRDTTGFRPRARSPRGRGT